MKKLLLLLSLLNVGAHLQAQNRVIYDDGRNELLEYRYNNANGASAGVIRSIIQQLVPNNYQYTGFDLRYYTKLRLKEVPNHNLEGSIRITEVLAQDVPKYKGFDFSDVVMPNEVDYTVSVKAGGTIVKQFSRSNERITLGKTEEYIFQFPDSIAQSNVTLLITNIDFRFKNSTGSEIERSVRAVNDYEKAGADITAMGNTLLAMNVTNPDPDAVRPMLADMESMDRMFSGIMRADFWDALRLKSNAATVYDPIGLRNMADRFGREFTAKRDLALGLASNLHIGYYEKALAMYNNRNVSGAKDNLAKSLAVRNDFAPAHYLIAVIEFDEKDYTTASKGISKVINELNPDRELLRRSFGVADDLRKIYTQDAAELRRQKKYREASAAVDQAYQFSKSLKGYTFDENELLQLRADIFKDDFNDRANLANEAYKKKDYEDAITKANEAYRFQQDNKILSDFDLPAFRRSVIQEYYKTELDKARQLGKDAKFEDALRALDQPYSLINRFGGDINDKLGIDDLKVRILNDVYTQKYNAANTAYKGKEYDRALTLAEGSLSFAMNNLRNKERENEASELISKIQLERYKIIVAEGDRLTKEGNNTRAIERYNEAKVLDSRYNFSGNNKVASVDSKISSSAKSDLISKADLLRGRGLNASNLKTELMGLQQYAADYSISTDSDVRAAFSRIETDICAKASAEFDAYMLETDKLIGQRQYIRAEEILNGGAQFIVMFPNCNVETTAISRRKETVTPCADFQRRLNEARNNESSSLYTRAIESYSKLAEEYKSSYVLNNNLNPDPAFDLYNYIINSNAPDFLHEGCMFYIKTKATHDQSFELLKKALERGFNVKASSYAQNLLGASMAEKNYTNKKDLKNACARVVPASLSKKMKTFNKSFSKRWKQLG